MNPLRPFQKSPGQRFITSRPTSEYGALEQQIILYPYAEEGDEIYQQRDRFQVSYYCNYTVHNEVNGLDRNGKEEISASKKDNQLEWEQQRR